MKNLDIFKVFSPINETFDARKNAIIYTRVSTKEQAENNSSLETQRSYCENYAKSNGIHVLKYFGGTYESAKTDERREFKKMIAFAKQNKSIGYIIVYSYDRFSRTGANAAYITESLKEMGINVIAVSQNIDTSTASGKFQQNILYMFSQFDNELRKDKTITAMRELLRKGYWLWVPPLGYKNINRYHKAVDWEIEISPEGKFIQKAFLWKVKNQYSNAEIVRKLNQFGVKINEKRLGLIFKNPFYCGILISKILPGEVNEGRYIPLVSKENFLKINSVEFKTSSVVREYDNEKLPLKRLIICDTCNTPLTGYEVKKKKIYYYKCRTKGCSCTKNAENLNMRFVEILDEIEISDSLIEPLKTTMEYVFNETIGEVIEDNKTNKKKLTEVTHKIDKIEERFAIGEISQEIFQKFLQQFMNEKERLSHQIENSKLVSSNLSKCIENVINLAKNNRKQWENSDLFNKQKIQNLVFPDGIRYNKENDTVLTTKMNADFKLIISISRVLPSKSKGENISNDDFSSLVALKGF